MYRTAVTIEKKSPFRTNQTNLVRPVGTHFPDSDRRSIHCPLHIDLGNTHFISAQLEKVSTSVNYNDSPHSTYKHSCLCFWECVCGFGEMLHNTMPSHFLVAQHSERERERERKRERERERERDIGEEIRISGVSRSRFLLLYTWQEACLTSVNEAVILIQT